MSPWKGVDHKAKDAEGKVQKAFNIKADVQDLSQDYDLEFCRESVTTQQGLLVVARLKPRKASLPGFSFRWDEKPNHLNVDIHGVGKAEESQFRNSRQGYRGHIFPKTIGQGRAFDVDIGTPSGDVFKGRIGLNLARDMSCTVKIGLTAQCKASVSRTKDHP